MQVVDLRREFKYNSIKLSDPNPALTPEEVKDFYQALQFAELNNSVVEGPVTKDGVATYTFTRAVGSKGATANELIERTLNADPATQEKALTMVADCQPFTEQAKTLVSVVNNRSGHPMPLPASAFGMWG
jgi:PRTRC genetic system protein C